MSDLTLNTYQELALRTAGNHGDFERTLIYTALGLNGEAGETAEMVKKAFFHGHELDLRRPEKRTWRRALVRGRHGRRPGPDPGRSRPAQCR